MADLLNDVQLKKELQELGATVGPITDSTRHLYAKKLDKLRAEAKKTGGRKPSPAKKASPSRSPPRSPTKNATVSPTKARSTRTGRRKDSANSEEEDELLIEREVRSKRVLKPAANSTPVDKAPPKALKSAKIPGLANKQPPPTSPASDTSPFQFRSAILRKIQAAVYAPTVQPVNTNNEADVGSDTTGARRNVFQYSEGESGDEFSPIPTVNRSANTSFLPPSQQVEPASARRHSPRRPVEPASSYSPRDYSPSRPRAGGRSYTRPSLYGSLGDRGADLASPPISPAVRRIQLPRSRPLGAGWDISRQVRACGDALMSVPWRLILIGIVGAIFVAIAFRLIVVNRRVIGERLGHIGGAATAMASAGAGAANDTLLFFYTNMVLPLLCIMTLAALSYGLYKLYMHRRQVDRERRAKVYDMVERICAILQARASSTDSYVSVPHIRDMLIKPFERTAENMRVWQMAVDLINTEESRVSTETMLVDGRESMVWCWSDNAAVASDERQPSPSAALTEPFSNCLKLRQVFTLGAAPVATVQSALLRAVGNGRARCVHLRLNERDGIAYMRFVSKADASRAYALLNNHLDLGFGAGEILAKYVAQQRYNQRYPDSVGLGMDDVLTAG